MRDHLCVENECREGIEYNYEFIEENREDIKDLEEDIKNKIQRYPSDNTNIIEARHLRNSKYLLENIRAKYSLGEKMITLEEDFENAISDLVNMNKKETGYLNLLWMVALGVLLETDQQNMKRLAKVVEKQKMKDFVIDYLLCASDIGWTKINHAFYEEIPYSNTKKIIELAQTDKKEASDRLHTYMEKEWFQGHYDYEWRNAHKEPGYIGFWSFETAAIAKILELDDEGLKDNIHYPYDLAHYKNNMELIDIPLNQNLEKTVEEEPEDWIEGIGNNPTLEKIIPVKWHSFVNELISDYQALFDEQFYDKYKEPLELEQIWFYKDEFKEENEEKNLLGTLIVFALTQRDYILQLDYKDDLEDYIHTIKDFWQESETKLIEFDIGYDQHYYAQVPIDANVENMYEVIIKNVK
ncbi:DUF1911 domain-containing protein [Virgibacillus sp. MSJ-26]|uniref:PoNe immunity protein domain-containing protein n=1 Tax=Virgibacillus sp. MSJ-26 TaxID=2841522 RepID=UPI001C122FBC|nr:PoNe immunity protein domain-containing protein [Virgibacillus sp. MSJ-26]MBU5465771.1 DUF1911 domain-containing protein [Virgibacillus sp. MSJ-26]